MQFIFESVLIPAIFALGAYLLAGRKLDRELRNKARWDTKYEACLQALRIVDARFAWSTFTQDGKQVSSLKQKKVSIADVRSAMNQLAITCQRPEVLEAFLTALGMHAHGTPAPVVSGDAINPLRNEIRKELGFNPSDLKLPADMAWIADVPGAEEEQ